MSGTFGGVLVARRGLSSVMVGRNRELDVLRDRLAARGGPRVALVSGEAGVGKTRLVLELLGGVAPGATVLSAQAEPTAMGRPFQLLLDALAPRVATWETVPAPLRPWEEAVSVLLSPVAPALAGAGARPFRSDELLGAAVEVVRHLVDGAAPALVVFEGLHWADPDSLAVFGRVAASDLDLLLVGSYRPEALDRRHVTDRLAAVERQRIVDHLVLTRLGVEDVADMVRAVRAGDIAYSAAAALHRRTGGNPFFVEELLLAAGDAPVDELADLPLPVTLTEAVIRRLDGLSPEARHVIDAASVLGQRIPFDVLASLTGLGEEPLVAVLRTLVDQGLLVEENPDVFSFRHALTREAVAGRLLGRERRRLHEKALGALQEAGSTDWAALAHHAAGATRWDDMVQAARRGAAEYLRSGATHQALWLAEMGLSEADADLELLELATRASWYVGLPATAVERAEQWRRLAEATGTPADQARALRVLARLRFETGDAEAHGAAVAAAQKVAEQLPAGEDRAWVVNLAAEAAMLRGGAEAAVGLADEALALAGPHPATALRAAVMVNRGSALLDIPGAEPEGAAELTEAIEAAVAAGDYLSALRGAHNLVHWAFAAWAPERSERLLRRMEELIERGGRQDWSGTVQLLWATYLAWTAGDLQAARRRLAAAGGLTGDKVPWSRSLGAELAIEAGETAEAESLLASIPAVSDDPDYHVIADALRLQAARARGDRAAVAERTAVVVAAVTGIEPGSRVQAADPASNALAESLRHGATADMVRPAAEFLAGLASRNPCPYGVDPGWPRHLAAALAEADDQPDTALGGYRAAATSDRHRAPAARASAHAGAARCLMTLGRSEEAAAEAERAVALLGRWPGWRRDDAAALLGRLRARSRPQPAGDLTGREREVAALLGEGLTNADIASRLYMSPKTASVHVSNILRKLGMSTRAEVAAWAARRGVDGGGPGGARP